MNQLNMVSIPILLQPNENLQSDCIGVITFHNCTPILSENEIMNVQLICQILTPYWILQQQCLLLRSFYGIPNEFENLSDVIKEINNNISKEREVQRSIDEIDINESIDVLPEKITQILRPYLECDSIVVLQVNYSESNCILLTTSILLFI